MLKFFAGRTFGGMTDGTATQSPSSGCVGCVLAATNALASKIVKNGTSTLNTNLRMYGPSMSAPTARKISRLLLLSRLCTHLVEVAGIVAFGELAFGFAPAAVDHAAALHGGALGQHVGPAVDVLVFMHRQELAAAVEQPLRQ